MSDVIGKAPPAVQGYLRRISVEDRGLPFLDRDGDGTYDPFD